MQRKDQTAILNQLYNYQLVIEDHDAPYLGDLIKGGYCYGLSLTRAAMRIMEKPNWWEDALDKILAWDRKAVSLEQEYHLVDADENSPITTLKAIFERVTHYIVFNQATYPHARCNQYSFLRPGGLFMMLQKDGVALHIKDHYLIPGHFNQNHIIHILNNNTAFDAIKNNICLIHNIDHTCELSYQDGNWIFFNPNYSDGKAKSFSSLKALAQEMTRVLGNNIGIELACTTKLKMNPFPYYYDTLLTKYPETLIQDEGLAFITQHNMDLLTKIINSLKNNDKLAYLKPHMTDADGRTLLMEAAEHGHVKAITALCKAGALPNQADRDGWTPLMIAAHEGHAQAILALYAFGAAPNQAKPDGWTPLMSAAQKGRIKAVLALCKIGASPNQADDEGWTPLMYAAEHGHARTITAICNAGALPNQVMPDGTTPLIIAAEHNRDRAITALCEAGALVNQADKDGMTPLMFAAEYGNIRAITALCEAGALLNQADKDGMTPLMFAAQFGHLGALNQLLRHQADPGTKSLVRLSCILAFAKTQGRQQAVQTLIKQQPPQWTALDAAVFFGHQKIVTVLLDKMPNVDIRTLDKLYKLAQAMNHTNIMEVLKKRKIKSAGIKKVEEKQAKISKGVHSSTFFKDTAGDDAKKPKEQSHLLSPASTPKANSLQRA